MTPRYSAIMPSPRVSSRTNHSMSGERSMKDQSTMSQRDYDLGTAGFDASTRRRSKVLAERLERGARDLIALARTLSSDEWETRIPKDGRKIGVVIHHVASMYPIEIKFALILASGRPVEGVTWDDIHALNGQHAKDNDAVTKDAAIELLRANAETASSAVRSLSDAELDTAAAVSLNGDAPLTCQFFIEDHALRHSFYHLSRIRQTLGR
jgi:hypothetical protein